MSITSFLLSLARIKTIPFSSVDEICQEYSKQLAGQDVDCIVSIERGGYYLGKKISEELKAPHLSVMIGRKRRVEIEEPSFLRLAIDNFRFEKEQPILLKGLEPLEKLAVKNKKVLLIDDAVRTGKTLEVAIQHLLECSVSEIFIWVLGNMKEYPVKHSLKGTFCYPWSRLSSEYGTFIRFYKTEKRQL